MKVGDLVKYNVFPHENDIFVIRGSKENPAIKADPYIPGGKTIKIEDGKDFIIVKHTSEGSGHFIHVTKEELKEI